MTKPYILDKENDRIIWYCPGCKATHPLSREGWKITFDNGLGAYPSILVTTEDSRCHSYLVGDEIIYTVDSTHKLSGETVKLRPVPQKFITAYENDHMKGQTVEPD